MKIKLNEDWETNSEIKIIIIIIIIIIISTRFARQIAEKYLSSCFFVARPRAF